MLWVALTALAVGLSMIIRRKAGGSAYVRRHPNLATTEEQMQQIYLVLGILISLGALLGLVMIAASSR
jgi:hypothetical protein